MAANARVLIVARDDQLASELAGGLDRLGWRTVTARGLQGAIAAIDDLPVEACVVDLADVGGDIPFLAERLKGKVECDNDTARRLFTLVTALHWKG